MYRSFKTHMWYHALGAHGVVRPGSLIMFAQTLSDGTEHLKLGKILGLVERDGTGKAYEGTRKDPVYTVLMAADDLHFGYVQHVRKSAIRRDVNPGAFARWFLFGEAPDINTALAVSEYGALNDTYLAKYLDKPEGRLTFPPKS